MLAGLAALADDDMNCPFVGAAHHVQGVGAENPVIATDLVFRVVRGPSKLDIWLRDFGGMGN